MSITVSVENMDPELYTAASNPSENIAYFKTNKDQKLLKQVTIPAKNTVLHVIAQHQDSGDAIQEILAGQDFSLLETLLTWKNSQGETALYIASRNRHLNVVQQLLTSAQALFQPDLQIGSDGVVVSLAEQLLIENAQASEEAVPLAKQMVRISNKNGDTPLHEAVNNKDEKIVELLVKADPYYEHLQNNLGKTPLYLALEKRKRLKDYSLLDKFVFYSIHSYHVMHSIHVKSYEPTLKTILDICKTPGIGGPDGETVLHVAARREDTSKWISELCKRFPDTTTKQDSKGFSPLHYAAYFNNRSAAKYLTKADKSMAYTTADKDKHDSITPLHIAASKGYTEVIEEILANCQDCWDCFTSKGQNILHLAALGLHTECISFIMKKPWSINLLNMKDNDGNTPSHLLLSSLPRHYRTIKPLLEHSNVNFDAFNKDNSTPLEMLEKAEMEFSAKKVNILKRLEHKLWNKERIPWTIVASVNEKSDDKKAQRLEEMKATAETHLLVAALIATVTFAAGFTLPGGYDGNEGPNQGMAVLIKKQAFRAFAVTDTIALISSCVAIFLHFSSTLYKNDESKISRRYSVALMFLVIAMISMAITFVTGLYVVLEKSPPIAVTVATIGCCGISYLLYLIRKVYRDMGYVIEEYFLLMCLVVVASPFSAINKLWACLKKVVGFSKYLAFRSRSPVGEVRLGELL